MKNTETLKKNYEFRHVLTKGKSYFGRYIAIYVLKEYQQFNRIGIAVGKKFGKAVKRNQFKRWIRQSYTMLESFLTEPYQIVFMVKKNVFIEDMDYWKIKDDMEKLFQKAGMIK